MYPTPQPNFPYIKPPELLYPGWMSFIRANRISTIPTHTFKFKYEWPCTYLPPRDNNNTAPKTRSYLCTGGSGVELDVGTNKGICVT